MCWDKENGGTRDLNLQLLTVGRLEVTLFIIMITIPVLFTKTMIIIVTVDHLPVA